MESIVIDGRKIGPNEPPYIVAEVSANHNGSLDRALNTIRAARQHGASAVKLQSYTADTMTIPSTRPEFRIIGGPWDGYTLYDLYKTAENPFEWHARLFQYAREIGITVFSTPFDESAVELLQSLDAPAYKIASFELTDLPLIDCVASTRKPLIISSGMASFGEIGDAIETAKMAGCSDIILLHCISSYPAPLEQANIKQVQNLAKEFEVMTGLSDHTLGTTAATVGVSLGAVFIEKHFILNRDDGGPDSSFSIEPAELEALCENARDAWRAVGKYMDTRADVEQASLQFRRSIYFVRDMLPGQIITKDDIRRIRPSNGLEPKFFSSLIGQVVTQKILAGTPTSWDLISHD